jgi:hypothetical protein
MKRINQRRLGGTEISAVCALYRPELATHMPKSAKTAADVWMRLVHGIEQPTNGRMQRGNDVEAELLQCYRENVGPAWRPDLGPYEKWIVQHPQHEWASASPDALSSAPPAKSIIEIKSQSVWAQNQWGAPGSDQVPERFLYQLAWTMACLEASEWLLLVGFGNDTKREDGSPVFIYDRTIPYSGERDVRVEAMLFELGGRFIDEFVRTRKAPPVSPTHNKRAYARLKNGEQGVGGVREGVEGSSGSGEDEDKPSVQVDVCRPFVGD